MLESLFVLLAQDVPVGEWALLYKGLIGLGVGLGVGLTVYGAAKGIGNIGSNAFQSIARQPEAGGRIGTNMIIAAALIEGCTLFGIVVLMLLSFSAA